MPNRLIVESLGQYDTTFEVKPIVWDLAQDMMVAPDRLDLELHPDDAKRFTSGEQRVRFFLDGLSYPQFDGMTDAAAQEPALDGDTFTVSCRDQSRWLVDALAPAMTLRNPSLARLAEILIAPYSEFIPGTRADATASRRKMAGKPINVVVGLEALSIIFTNPTALVAPYWQIEPEQKIWDVLREYAKQVGAHLWMDPEGYLNTAKPDYTQDPKLYGSGLYWYADGRKNMSAFPLRTSTSDRFATYRGRGSWSELVKVDNAAQPGTKKTQKKVHKFTEEVLDLGPPFFARIEEDGITAFVPRVEKPYDHPQAGVHSASRLRRTLRTEMERRLISSWGYEVTADSLISEDTGALWTMDTMVPVVDQQKAPFIDRDLYITAVHKHEDPAAQNARIRVIPPNLWLVDRDSLSPSEYDQATAPLIFW